MIAVDTNILVFAHREDASWHDAAYTEIVGLAEGNSPWAIPWPCIHEFLSVVTHPKIYSPPTPLDTALEQVTAWMEAPGLILLTELEGYWNLLSTVLESGRVAGPQVHDARIAALCLLHNVTELWIADRDFTRFPALKVRNPLIQQP